MEIKAFSLTFDQLDFIKNHLKLLPLYQDILAEVTGNDFQLTEKITQQGLGTGLAIRYMIEAYTGGPKSVKDYINHVTRLINAYQQIQLNPQPLDKINTFFNQQNEEQLRKIIKDLILLQLNEQDPVFRAAHPNIESKFATSGLRRNQYPSPQNGQMINAPTLLDYQLFLQRLSNLNEISHILFGSEKNKMVIQIRQLDNQPSFSLFDPSSGTRTFDNVSELKSYIQTLICANNDVYQFPSNSENNFPHFVYLSEFTALEEPQVKSPIGENEYENGSSQWFEHNKQHYLIAHLKETGEIFDLNEDVTFKIIRYTNKDDEFHGIKTIDSVTVEINVKTTGKKLKVRVPVQNFIRLETTLTFHVDEMTRRANAQKTQENSVFLDLPKVYGWNVLSLSDIPVNIHADPRYQGGQIIIQLQDDYNIMCNSRFLAEKNPNSWIIQLADDGSFRVVYGSSEQLGHPLRWQIVGHGLEYVAVEKQQMAGRTAQQLATDLSHFNQKFTLEKGFSIAPEHISLVGCELMAHDKQTGFALDFANVLDIRDFTKASANNRIFPTISARTQYVKVSNSNHPAGIGRKLTSWFSNGYVQNKDKQAKVILRRDEQQGGYIVLNDVEQEAWSNRSAATHQSSDLQSTSFSNHRYDAFAPGVGTSGRGESVNGLSFNFDCETDLTDRLGDLLFTDQQSRLLTALSERLFMEIRTAGLQGAVAYLSWLKELAATYQKNDDPDHIATPKEVYRRYHLINMVSDLLSLNLMDEHTLAQAGLKTIMQDVTMDPAFPVMTPKESYAAFMRDLRQIDDSTYIAFNIYENEDSYSTMAIVAKKSQDKLIWLLIDAYSGCRAFDSYEKLEQFMDKNFSGSVSSISVIRRLKEDVKTSPDPVPNLLADQYENGSSVKIRYNEKAYLVEQMKVQNEPLYLPDNASSKIINSGHVVNEEGLKTVTWIEVEVTIPQDQEASTTKVVTVVVPVSNIEQLAYELRFNFVEIARLQSGARWVMNGVDTWNRPTITPNRNGGATRYSAQYVIQLENDNAIASSAARDFNQQANFIDVLAAVIPDDIKSRLSWAFARRGIMENRIRGSKGTKEYLTWLTQLVADYQAMNEVDSDPDENPDPEHRYRRHHRDIIINDLAVLQSDDPVIWGQKFVREGLKIATSDFTQDPADDALHVVKTYGYAEFMEKLATLAQPTENSYLLFNVTDAANSRNDAPMTITVEESAGKSVWSCFDPSAGYQSFVSYQDLRQFVDSRFTAVDQTQLSIHFQKFNEVYATSHAIPPALPAHYTSGSSRRIQCNEKIYVIEETENRKMPFEVAKNVMATVTSHAEPIEDEDGNRIIKSVTVKVAVTAAEPEKETKVITVVIPRGSVEKIHAVLVSNSRQIADLPDNHLWLMSEVDTWKTPEIVKNEEARATNHSHQYVIQLENDQGIAEAAAWLAGKHPNETEFFQLDQQGKSRKISGEFTTQQTHAENKLRVQLVGHGDHGEYQQHVAEQTPEKLAENFAIFMREQRQLHPNLPELAHISLVACETVTIDKTDGFLWRFAAQLIKQGIEYKTISAYSGAVTVTGSKDSVGLGRKKTVISFSADGSRPLTYGHDSSVKTTLAWDKAQKKHILLDSVDTTPREHNDLREGLFLAHPIPQKGERGYAELRKIFYRPDGELDVETLIRTAGDQEQLQAWNEKMQRAQQLVEIHPETAQLSLSEAVDLLQQARVAQYLSVESFDNAGRNMAKKRGTVTKRQLLQRLYLSSEKLNTKPQAIALSLLWLHADSVGSQMLAAFFQGLIADFIINEKKAVGDLSSRERLDSQSFRQQFAHLAQQDLQSFLAAPDQRKNLQQFSQLPLKAGDYLLQGQHHALMLTIRQNADKQWTFSQDLRNFHLKLG